MELHLLYFSFLARGFRHWSPIVTGAVMSGRAADSVDNCLPLLLRASSLESLSVWIGFRSFRLSFIGRTVRPRLFHHRPSASGSSNDHYTKPHPNRLIEGGNGRPVR